MLAGEFVEQILRFFTQNVNQHVQTTAVRHAEHHFTGAAFACVTDHLFEHRDQRIAAFQREAFGAREFRAEVTFQAFGCCQLGQETFLLVSGKAGFPCYRLNTLLNPAFFFGRGDVHVFRADSAAVGLFERGNQLAQFHRIFADSK